jgi:hypothetical protein
MSQKGKPSTAHVYDNLEACIYCGMYKVNVEQMNHECTPAREAEEDKKNGK